MPPWQNARRGFAKFSREPPRICHDETRIRVKIVEHAQMPPAGHAKDVIVHGRLHGMRVQHPFLGSDRVAEGADGRRHVRRSVDEETE
jgi:hypothetical protein